MRKQLKLLTVKIEMSLKEKLTNLAEDEWGGVQSVANRILEKAVQEYDPKTINSSPLPCKDEETIAFGVRVPPRLKTALRKIVKSEKSTVRSVVSRMYREGVESYTPPVVEEESFESKITRAIRNLNQNQRNVFEAILNGQKSGHHLLTTRRLMDDELLERYKVVKIYRDREVSSYEYAVPFHVKAIWDEVVGNEGTEE